MINIKTCPTCGSRRVHPVHEDVKFTIRDRRVVVPDLDFIRCDACGEQLFDHEANQKIDAVIFGPRRRATRRKSA
jgi:YgiT-type zinc finger domain-containing protein